MTFLLIFFISLLLLFDLFVIVHVLTYTLFFYIFTLHP